jgi:hypothetical protein
LHRTDKELERVTFDPHWELPLSGRPRTVFPPSIEEERILLTAEETPRNLMREYLEAPGEENK